MALENSELLVVKITVSFTSKLFYIYNTAELYFFSFGLVLIDRIHSTLYKL